LLLLGEFHEPADELGAGREAAFGLTPWPPLRGEGKSPMQARGGEEEVLEKGGE